MHKPSGLRDYVVSILIATSILVFFSLYLVTRRGYFFDAPPSADPLFVPNKALAATGMTLLAFTFLIGPLSRYFNRWDYFLAYRKEIGIVGAFLAFFHGIVSYFFLPKKFPQEWLDFGTLGFGAGLVGIGILIALFVLSWKSIIARFSGPTWWFLQRWGLRLVIVATLLHVFVLKWGSWMKWIQQGGGKANDELINPWMPGLGILASLFIAWVVIVRCYETIFLFHDLGWKPKEITLDETLRLRGRRFMQLSFLVLIISYLFIVTRWMY